MFVATEGGSSGARIDKGKVLSFPRDSRQSGCSSPAVLPSPFLKWVGGKGRVLAQLIPLLPTGAGRMRHVEPFVGGGALFFHRCPGRALLSDVNEALVSTYRAIQTEVESVIDALSEISLGHCKEAYYGIRTDYNSSRHAFSSMQAARFIYLNKTCFNGLHRVNKKGEFNVPAGRYKNPKIVDAARLRAASLVLQGVGIEQASFEGLLETAKPGDFVYFDPPYEPVSRTASFTSYASDGFSREDQIRLRDVFVALDRRGCKLMLSNSDVPFIQELYDGFSIDKIAAPRAVNCKGRGRGRVLEVVVRNYT